MAENDIAGDLEKQVAALRSELERITHSLSESGFELLDEAQDGARKAVTTAKRKATEVAEEAQSEAAAVVQVARENPAITGAILAAVAIAGFAAGVLVGSDNNSRHRYW